VAPAMVLIGLRVGLAAAPVHAVFVGPSFPSAHTTMTRVPSGKVWISLIERGGWLGSDVTGESPTPAGLYAALRNALKPPEGSRSWPLTSSAPEASAG